MSDPVAVAKSSESTFRNKEQGNNARYSPRKPDRTLQGKVAIVTGAGAYGDEIGNGRASALLFAEDGCSVVCVDRDLTLAERTVAMIEEAAAAAAKLVRSDKIDGNNTNRTNSTTIPAAALTSTMSNNMLKAIAVQADVSKQSDCERIVQTTIEQYGRLDILFNCVGIGGAAGTAVDVDMEQFKVGFEVNVYSMVHMVKYAVPEMAKNDATQGWRGSIINMASVAGLKGGTPHLLYPTTKGTVVQMTRAMAFHHAAELIRVNCVCPGMVFTPMMYAGGMTEEAREARKGRSLLKTEGNAWDVASAVRFLAGDEARWVTGQDLVIDAGVTCAVGTDVPKSASVNG